MKGKKRNTKSAAKTKGKRAAGLAEKTEQILLTMPRIIAMQIGKDLVLLKQEESDLKMDLNKTVAQQKKLMAALAIAKKKNTAAAKKQQKTIQKNLQKLLQLAKELTKALATLKKQSQDLTQKKAKYSALQAQLMRFTKEWAKKPNKVVKKAKAKKSKTHKATVMAEGVVISPGTQIVEVIELPVDNRYGQKSFDEVS